MSWSKEVINVGPFQEVLDGYRTTTVLREAVMTFITLFNSSRMRELFRDKFGPWDEDALDSFGKAGTRLVGSLSDNTMGTLSPPDLDFLICKDLDDFSEFGGKLQEDLVMYQCGKTTLLYKLEIGKPNIFQQIMQRLIQTCLYQEPDTLKSMQMYTTRPDSGANDGDGDGDGTKSYLDANQLRLLTERVSRGDDFLPFERSSTGAAATARFGTDTADRALNSGEDYHTEDWRTVDPLSRYVSTGQNIMRDTFLDYWVTHNPDHICELDMVICLDIPYKELPESARLWENRNPVWPPAELITKVKESPVRISTKICHLMGDKDLHFHISPNVDTMIKAIDAYRKSIVVLKDLRELYIQPETKIIKSWALKNAILWCKQTHFPYSQPREGELILSVLYFLRYCLSCGVLPNFFDERDNFLVDATDEDCRKARDKIHWILSDPVGAVSRILEMPMTTSNGLLQLMRHTLNAFEVPEVPDELNVIQDIKIWADGLDYSDHRDQPRTYWNMFFFAIKRLFPWRRLDFMISVFEHWLEGFRTIKFFLKMGASTLIFFTIIATYYNYYASTS